MRKMKKICAISGLEFEVTEKDQEFYRRIGVPAPTLSPKERVRRRMAYRNERNLYKTKCDATGENILAMYHPDTPYKIYQKDYWYSDKWDARDYARDIDFNRSFFEQLSELQKAVPRANLAIFVNSENSEYCNYVGDTKNCYLCFGSIFIEDCMYGNPYYSKNCVDCFLVRKSELAYECIDCEALYNCLYLQDCYECSDCFFGYDLKACRNCIGCVGLRNKQYYIFNKEYSREDYEKFTKDFLFCDGAKVEVINQKLEELKLQHPRLSCVVVNCENVTGSYIFNSKNCFDCFQVSENEDCSYNIQTTTSKDCYDMNYTEENELCYEYLGNYRNHTAAFCLTPYGSNNIWYCDYVNNCKDCFACVGLKNGEFCIFNKQYPKDEYFENVARIKKMMEKDGEWGEFFPVKNSFFGYNETVANDYFPLEKDEALKRAYKWRDEDKTEFMKTDFVYPIDIGEVGDDICDKILSCEISGRNYKITPAELQFYRKMKLPIPRKHFVERHKARLRKRLPYELFERQCASCGITVKTAYNLNRAEKILCEKCYLEKVY